jgi:hypothetical protein
LIIKGSFLAKDHYVSANDTYIPSYPNRYVSIFYAYKNSTGYVSRVSMSLGLGSVSSRYRINKNIWSIFRIVFRAVGSEA